MSQLLSIPRTLLCSIALIALCIASAALHGQDSIPDSTARAQALRVVKVTERKEIDRRIDEANQRRRAGFGFFADSTSIAKLPGLREAFNYPNVHTGGTASAWTVYMTGNYSTSDIQEVSAGTSKTSTGDRGGFGAGRPKQIQIKECTPTIYIDGLKGDNALLPALNKNDIALIEIFNSPQRVPLRYQESETCAAVLFWTKQYVNR